MFVYVLTLYFTYISKILIIFANRKKFHWILPVLPALFIEMNCKVKDSVTNLILVLFYEETIL